jgi:putative restriction endonuclease
MAIRIKRKNTTLFFDSFKHFKNNFSNLVCLELPKLIEVGVEDYFSIKSVNYKSKYPDMKKIGLINYKKPSDFTFEVSEEGLEIYKIISKNKEMFNYDSKENKRLESIKPDFLWRVIDHNDKDKINKELIKLLISYYDTVDCIRPYLSLIKIIESHNIIKIDYDMLCVILAQTKSNIINKKIDIEAFNNLDEQTKKELKRPISYITNGLETAGIINQYGKVIYDKEYVKNIVMDLNEIYFRIELYYDDEKTTGRSAEEQRKFREEILKAYDYKCAITGESIKIKTYNSTTYLLDAAHIIPYSDSGSFSVNNGILLSVHMHRMFDRKLFAFEYTDEGKLKVVISKSEKIKDKTGILNNINNLIVNLPNNKKHYPDADAIDYRRNNYLLI